MITRTFATLAAAVLLAALATLLPLHPFAVLPSGGLAMDAHAAQIDTPVTILAFGDSLTAGFGLPAGQAVPALVEAMLKADGYTVRMINAGVSGDTTAGGLARLGWSLQDNPDIAIVELGANDGLRGLDLGHVEANLDAILKRLQAQHVRTLLAGMRVPPNMGRDYADRFNALFPRLAKKYGVDFMPFYLEDVAGIHGLNQPDGIHPTAKGTEIIARNIYPYVKRLVEAELAERQVK